MKILTPTIGTDYCSNCHQPTEESAFLHEHLNGYVVAREVCLDCVDEVIQYRHRIRNVSEMTEKLKSLYNWNLTREMGHKLVPCKSIRHI